MNDRDKAKAKLLSEGYTCVLCRGDSIHTSISRGVRPLVEWLESSRCSQSAESIESAENFEGFSAADKVVGKATAFLYVLLGVKAVYACVISRSALKTLTEHSIAVEYDVLTENIVNRKGDGICPFEAAVLDIEDPGTAYSAIKNKMREMNISF